MRWIAAGSLLLDDESAARLTFRALVDDPSRTEAAVVGVSPEFELEPIVGVHLVDLERRTVSDVQPSDSSLARVAASPRRSVDDGPAGVRPRGAVGGVRRPRARRTRRLGAARRHPDGRGLDPRPGAGRGTRQRRRPRRAAAPRAVHRRRARGLVAEHRRGDQDRPRHPGPDASGRRGGHRRRARPRLARRAAAPGDAGSPGSSRPTTAPPSSPSSTAPGTGWPTSPTRRPSIPGSRPRPSASCRASSVPRR